MADLQHSKNLCVTQVPLFQDLPNVELTQINNLVVHQYLTPGTLVFSPLMTSRLVIVHTGKIKVYQLNANGQEQVLRILGAGDVEGEALLFGDLTSTVYGEVLKAGEMCTLSGTDFQVLLANKPQMALQLLDQYHQKTKQLERQLSYLSINNKERRVGTYLVDQVKSQGQQQITLPMKLKDLATYLALTPETLSRNLARLSQKKYLKQHLRQVEILNLAALQANLFD
ncbi:Crp/Fnr family transcriptional regulator [Weissella kandleri]|uniref:Crp/Fnr family transcriptional regulator n=1 Tax=Weissella kandleri TaxID=1616 RepID=UPI0007093738|nr:Crp/Fnr family transcriptional regulator [Weissella kandleri]